MKAIVIREWGDSQPAQAGDVFREVAAGRTAGRIVGSAGEAA